MPKQESEPEQLNTENQETQSEQKTERGNRPVGAGSVPEWSLWQPKIVRGKDGQQRETSVKSPDGKTYEIKDGEQFVVEKGENGDYEAAIVGADGEKTILKESLASKKARLEKEDKEKIEEHKKYLERVFQEEREKEAKGVFDIYKSETSQKKENSEEIPGTKQEGKSPYNPERLNEITKKCSEMGANFGKEVKLTDEDKRQIEIVANLVEERVDKAVENDDDWKDFTKIKTELLSKGLLVGDGWLVDGGENASVQQKSGDKNKKESPTQIVVPSKVFNAFHYKDRVVRKIRDRYLKPSDEQIRGQSARGLASDLEQLKYFIKQTEGKQ